MSPENFREEGEPGDNINKRRSERRSSADCPAFNRGRTNSGSKRLRNKETGRSSLGGMNHWKKKTILKTQQADEEATTSSSQREKKEHQGSPTRRLTPSSPTHAATAERAVSPWQASLNCETVALIARQYVSLPRRHERNFSLTGACIAKYSRRKPRKRSPRSEPEARGTRHRDCAAVLLTDRLGSARLGWR